MKVSLSYRYCVGAYCEQCDADFEVLELYWAAEGRFGHWPPRARDGGLDHHFEDGDRFSTQVQLEYLVRELQLKATVELLPQSRDPYSEGTLRILLSSGVAYEEELLPAPDRAPTEAHIQILRRFLFLVGVDAEVQVLPSIDFSIDE